MIWLTNIVTVISFIRGPLCEGTHAVRMSPGDPQAMLSSTHGWNLICCYNQFSGGNKKKAQPLRLCAASCTWPQVKILATADDLTSVLGTYVIGGENQLAYVAS